MSSPDLKFRRDEWGQPADPTPAEYSWEYARALFGLPRGAPLSYAHPIENLQAEIQKTEEEIARWESASASTIEHCIAIDRGSQQDRRKAFEGRGLRRGRVQAMVDFYEAWRVPDVLERLKESALVTLRGFLLRSMKSNARPRPSASTRSRATAKAACCPFAPLWQRSKRSSASSNSGPTSSLPFGRP